MSVVQVEAGWTPTKRKSKPAGGSHENQSKNILRHQDSFSASHDFLPKCSSNVQLLKHFKHVCYFQSCLKIIACTDCYLQDMDVFLSFSASSQKNYRQTIISTAICLHVRDDGLWNDNQLFGSHPCFTEGSATDSCTAVCVCVCVKMTLTYLFNILAIPKSPSFAFIPPLVRKIF